MTDTTVPLIRITGPGELVAAVPALLGFRPTESLVAVLLEDRRVRCTMRADLTEGLSSQAELIADVCRRADAATVLLVIYSADERWAGEVHAAVGDLDRQGLTVSEALLVHDGRFRSLLCQDTACCPPEGLAVPEVVSELEAHRVSQGLLAVCGSREDLQEAYRARPDLAPTSEVYDAQENVVQLPVAQRCTQALKDCLELIDACHSSHPEDVDSTRARLALLLHDSTVRDHMLAVLAHDDDLRAATWAVTWLALTAAEPFRGPAAASAACLHAATGEDPVATWALLDLAEGESLARLVEAVVAKGVHPDHVRGLLIETLPLVQEQIDRS